MSLIRRLFNRRSNRGKEPGMADATNTATPPADDKSGITIDQVKALIAESLKPVTEQLGQTAQTLKSLGDNQKVIADTLKDLPPAPAAGKSADGESNTAGDGKAPAAGVTLEDVQRLLDERDAKRQQDAARAEAIAAAKAAVIKDKLGDDASYAELLPDTDDATVLGSYAEKLAAKIAAAKPTIPSAAGDGGKSPNAPEGEGGGFLKDAIPAA